MSKIIIVGGGASGLVAAIYASINNEVIILEKNSKCGKKILVTGNGRCNYFNSDFTKEHFVCDDMSILNNIITNNNKNEIMDLFDKIGIVPNIKDGYYYPMSNQAISIREALVKECIERKVKIITDCTVESIDHNNTFNLYTNLGVFNCDKVILSVGSHAGVKDETIGYNILKKFNHTINPVLPALVQLVSNNNILKKASGVRLDSKLSLYEDNKLIKTVTGELQITDYGISGICTYQLSLNVSLGLSKNKKEVIHINFIPWLVTDFTNYMDKRNKIVKNRTISELFDGLMNYKLANLILELCNIDLNDSWENISDDKKNRLKSMLVDFNIEINSTKDFINAQTCLGGVPLKEINPNTMQSKYNKDLYITGELLDCTGECGGYNLGFAWITGYIAGSSLNDKD